MDLADITELCSLRGWKIYQLADVLRVSRWTVYRWRVQQRCDNGPANVIMERLLAKSRRVHKRKAVKQ